MAYHNPPVTEGQPDKHPTSERQDLLQVWREPALPEYQGREEGSLSDSSYDLRSVPQSTAFARAQPSQNTYSRLLV